MIFQINFKAEKDYFPKKKSINDLLVKNYHKIILEAKVYVFTSNVKYRCFIHN